MENSVNIASRYFDRRDITLAPSEIVVLSCMRNELQRLPYFLDYYRKLGVSRFLLVDNNSTDGTEEYLRRQGDVEYFKTASSYRGSSAGRLWMQELADTYAVDRWVITVDVDELLVFPGIEDVDVSALCRYLEENKYSGVFTVMLDMYSDRRLAETVYTPGTAFLETCSFFEPDTYQFRPSQVPPFLNVTGGPRGRLFVESGAAGSGPSMKKVPLVKWHRGFSYIYSTHAHRYLPLADITGLLLHFKFFASFEETAAQEAVRGDRRQEADYRTYQDTVDGDLCFFGDHSRRYETASELVRIGIMCTTPRYADFVADHLGLHDEETGELSAEGSARLGRLLPASEPVVGMTLRALPSVWALVNERRIATFFGRAEPTFVDHRAEFVRSMRHYVRVIDVHSDHLLIGLDEPALHRWERSGLGVSIYVGERLVRTALIDGTDPTLEVDIDALEARVYRLKADVGGAAVELADDGHVLVTVYLVDGHDDAPPPDVLDVESSLRLEDVRIHSRPWYPRGLGAAECTRFGGVLERLRDGRLRGWTYDALADRFDVGVNIYINGRLARHARPTVRRRNLALLRGRPDAPSGRGYLEFLPLKYFEENGEQTLRIEAFIAGTNVALRRSPIRLPAGATSARWDKERHAWITGGCELFDDDGAPGLDDLLHVERRWPIGVRLLKRSARSGVWSSRPTGSA